MGSTQEVEQNSFLTDMSGREMQVLAKDSECGDTFSFACDPLSHTIIDFGQICMIQIMRSPKVICLKVVSA